MLKIESSYSIYKIINILLIKLSKILFSKKFLNFDNNIFPKSYLDLCNNKETLNHYFLKKELKMFKRLIFTGMLLFSFTFISGCATIQDLVEDLTGIDVQSFSKADSDSACAMCDECPEFQPDGKGICINCGHTKGEHFN